MRVISKAVSLLLFLFSISVFSQDINNLKNVDVDDLSDSQIEAYVKRAQESGMTMEQLELLARQRGMSSTQLAKLRQRILKVQSGGSKETGLGASEDRLRGEYGEQDKVSFFDDLIPSDTLKNRLPIFGSEIFESALTFQSPMNVATPENYVLGPGDEVIIDIYGASEITYQETISPDGKILISGVGPISLGGISVKAAKTRVFNRLSSIYSGMKWSRPNTFMDLSVGDIRTITVNVVGNVKRPGTYAISSFSSAFNALYEAGGPNRTGSMRQIEIMRAGESIATLDVYKYFFEGDISGNPQLQDGDAVVVKSYVNRVAFAGEVKQPAIYEFFDEETFQDLINYSGGSASNGYNENITLFRSKGSSKSVVTFNDSEYDGVKLFDGDSVYIPKVPEIFTNRVKVEGAVDQPGFYELKESMKLSDLLEMVKLSRDAYLKRGNIISLNNDLTFSNTSFDINKVLDGVEDYELKSEDLIKIPSILDIEERKTVTILGEVNNGGKYPFVDGMTVEDLIAISGGLKSSASTSSVEVARRVDKDSKEFRTAIIFNYSVQEDLGIDSASNFILKPFDLVSIKASALFRTQRTVKIEGEVLFPGIYSLETEEDKLTDVLQRAGGLTSYAYPEGASLIRDIGQSRNDGDLETTSTDEGDFYRRQQLERLVKRDSLDDINANSARKEGVGIELDEAIKDPNSKFNLILQDGDVISVPKQLQTVRVRGQVLYPTRVNFDETGSFRNYISLAGGFTDRAQVKKSYIVYANGRAKRTNKFLFWKIFPKVEPGADIFIPEKPERRPLSPGEVLGITGGLASLSLVIIQIINLTN